MKLNDFDYILPVELIAKQPLLDRDQARLMVIERKTGKITHHVFAQIEQFLPMGSLLILNDSKVIPARLIGKREKTGGKVEVFLLNALGDGYCFKALIKPLRRLKIDEKIIFPGGSIYAQLKDPHEKIIRFNRKNIERSLKSIGHIPLPPYIKREDRDLDKTYYQTVYARSAGSVAAPTAGLHFTKSLLDRIRLAKHQIERLTLHVNYATFTPVKTDDITQHVMHAESYALPAKTVQAVMRAKAKGQKIVAVGTTSCRVLETFARKLAIAGGVSPQSKNFDPGDTPPVFRSVQQHLHQAQTKGLSGMTNIFIYPGYQFMLTDILITNFHLPKSTLLMLVEAFGSSFLIKEAYEEAIRQKYRFYSYGDCMMII